MLDQIIQNYHLVIWVLFLSIAFGVTMKIADLLDEHGLKLFKGASLMFGFLWGIIGALLIFDNNILANFILAMLIHWILRYRIDYLNHGIAVSIILFGFVYALPNFSTN